MASFIRYLTHPQVQVDAMVPVPDWSLSGQGRTRVGRFARASCLAATTAIVSSGERKAKETAAIIADALGLTVSVRTGMHENDRSGTGFLPPAEFEITANAFFAQPESRIRGWERAGDAQRRIVAEFKAVVALAVTGDLLIVGHGAVGTLLYCHLAGLPIDRSYDQPTGGGCIFTLSSADCSIVHSWRSIEDMA